MSLTDRFDQNFCFSIHICHKLIIVDFLVPCRQCLSLCLHSLEKLMDRDDLIYRYKWPIIDTFRRSNNLFTALIFN